MKKVMVFMILFFFFSITLVFSIGLSMGGTVGGTIGWINGSDWINALNFFGGNNKIKLGFSVGIFINIELHEYLSIQPGILFSNQGGAYQYYYMGNNIDGTISSNVLEIPILFNPKIPIGTGYFVFSIGPEIIIFLGDVKIKESGFGMTVETGRTPDNDIVFGLSAGIGYEYPLGSGNIIFDLKYTKTLTEIFRGDNSSFNGVGIRIGFSTKTLRTFSAKFLNII
ncbi:MAG: PorT family protein [Planctomycetes bacterium]|nr:PorT family protein [Planctomycetota bacterium]